MELQSWKKMNYLRIDNGLEFHNEEFNKYYIDCRITRQKKNIPPNRMDLQKEWIRPY